MQSITFMIPSWLSYIIAAVAVVYLLSQLLLVILYCISWVLGRKIKKLKKITINAGPQDNEKEFADMVITAINEAVNKDTIKH